MIVHPDIFRDVKFLRIQLPRHYLKFQKRIKDEDGAMGTPYHRCSDSAELYISDIIHLSKSGQNDQAYFLEIHYAVYLLRCVPVPDDSSDRSSFLLKVLYHQLEGNIDLVKITLLIFRYDMKQDCPLYPSHPAYHWDGNPGGSGQIDGLERVGKQGWYALCIIRKLGYQTCAGFSTEQRRIYCQGE
jgi:hypothetical protein